MDPPKIIATAFSRVRNHNHMSSPILRKRLQPKLFCLEFLKSSERDDHIGGGCPNLDICNCRGICSLLVGSKSYPGHIIRPNGWPSLAPAVLPVPWNITFKIETSEGISFQFEFLSGERACGLKASECYQPLSSEVFRFNVTWCHRIAYLQIAPRDQVI